MTGDKEVQILRMTLDELINAMEPQARKDKALISKCVDGLTEYAAELRQKAGDAGKEQISALRRLVDELAGYWGLDAKTVDHVTAFDRKIQEVDQAVHQWTPTQEHSVVQKMLCNEKYIGDALLQKTYIADLFTREKRVNNGELPKYYVHDCHPAIIDRETFQKVQEEIARRSSLKKTSSKAKTQLGKYCGKYVLSELLVCGECGSPYRRVIWTQKGVKRVVWRCQNRLEHGRKICKQSPTLDEGDIHDAVISAMNELFRMQAAKDAVKAGIAAVLAGEEQTMSLPAVELQIRNLQERQLELFQLIVSAGADCTDYDEELQQVNIAKTRLMAQKAELEKEQRGAAAFESRLAELDMALEQASGTLTDFDELTVRQLVSNIKVLDKDSLLICFKDGTEITQAMQRRQTA